MVRVYRFVLIVFACLFSFSDTFAMLEDKENLPPSPLKQKRKASEESGIFQSPTKEYFLNDEGIIPTFSPLLKYSPITAERKFWSPIRREMACEAYPYNDREYRKLPISTPKVRKIYKKHDRGNFFKAVRFKGKLTFQVDYLFDPEALVLSKLGIWETNLERMKNGLSPIGHKGIASESERILLDESQIYKIQRYYRIDLQHITQKDTGDDENPICEMTHAAHMGLNARMILKHDFKLKEVCVLYSSLEKEEAEAFISPDQFMVTNVLHFRKGSSFIDRNAFKVWRDAYWKERACKIEEGHFNKKPPSRIAKALIFHSPKKQIVEDMVLSENTFI